MVKKQQHKTNSSSTSPQIRKPTVTTRSRSQNTVELAYIRSTEQQKKIAFEMKRKRKSDIELDTPGEVDGIDRQSPNNTNNTLIQNSDSKSGLSPSKRAKLLTRTEHNNNDKDIIQDVIQTNVESGEFRLKNNLTQNGVEIPDGLRNNVHNELLRNGIESKNMVQSGIKNGYENVDGIITGSKNEDKDNEQEVQSNRKIVQENDFVYNIELIIDSFKDVIEIRGTQMVIGNYAVEYGDYQKFLTLLNELMDTLEKNDSEKLLQSAKKIGFKENTGQVLNLKLFRAKISKRAYKSLNEFQDDFTCTCNDAIATNPEKHDIGVNFLKFGTQLFEQAYNELPNSIRQLGHCDAKAKVIKRPQKIALIQPTLDGHVFSSGAINQPEDNTFKLVGELQEMAVVSSQSMDKKEIPTIGSILPKRKRREFPLYEERKLPGVKFHKYKAYASFAPIYDSRTAMLSYEDTVLTCAYIKHGRASKNTDVSDLSEKDDVTIVSEEVSQKESSEIASSSKQNNSVNDIFIRNNIENNDEKLFEDIDVDLLYKQFNEKTKIDQVLDENVEIFKEVQSMQEKRLIKYSNTISAKEKELAIKLQNKLADIISEVPPSDLVSFDSIEYAMDNLPIKEKSFKGMLPPDRSFAHPTNVVSRDVFGRLSRVGKSSEDRKDANVPKAQKKSDEALPQVPRQVLAGSSSITPRSAPRQLRQQSLSSQSLHQHIQLPPSSMTYPRPSRVPRAPQPSRVTRSSTQPSRAASSQVMRMPYEVPQGMSTQMHASYQMTYPRPLSAPSRVPPYYHPSQRYPPPYAYYPQYGYSMGNSTWQQRPRYH